MEIKNLNTYLKPQLTRASLVQMLSYKLGIYLAYSSLDGAPQRQSLRTELRYLLDEIETHDQQRFRFLRNLYAYVATFLYNIHW